MAIVALVLILLVAAFVVAVSMSSQVPVSLDPSNGSIDLSAFGANVPVSELGLVCAGAGAVLALILAGFLLRVSARRARANRKQQKAMQRTAASQAASGGAKSQPKPLAARSTAGEQPAPTGTPAATTTSGPTDHSALLDEVDAVTGDDPKR